MTNSEILMIVFTAVIAVGTIVAALIFNNQLSVMQGQLDEMKSTGKQTEALIEANKKAAEAAQIAANAAIAGNNLNRAIFISSQRPWVYADVTVAGPWKYDVNGVNITLLFVLKNIGHSPALYVSVHPEIYAVALGVDTTADPIGKQREICNGVKSRPFMMYGNSQTIFPGNRTEFRITFGLPKEEIARLTQKVEFISPLIVGCIDYTFVFEHEHHQTGFFFDLISLKGPFSAKTGDVPADQLILRPSFGGTFAD